MKPLISNQYGAMVMAAIPFIYGTVLAKAYNFPQFLLFLAWVNLYLTSYPFLNLFKKQKNWRENTIWAGIYSILTMIFAIPCYLLNPEIAYFGFAIMIFTLFSIYYTWRQQERCFANDFVGLVIFSIVGVLAYYFSTKQWDENVLDIFILPLAFFSGTTLYIKSVMRERKNIHYLIGSIIYHIICVWVFYLLAQFELIWVFSIALLRAIIVPILPWINKQWRLMVTQIGLIEMAISVIFLLGLLNR